MPRFFNADGNEFKITPDPNAEVVLTIGGELEQTGVTIFVYSEKLNRNRVTELLQVEPTDAWNAGERHSYGYHGKTRIDDFGKWYLSIEIDDEPINQKIERLFAVCTQNLDSWRLLSEEYETWLTVVGYMSGFNQVVRLSRKSLKLIAERNLDFHFDIYGDTSEEDDE